MDQSNIDRRGLLSAYADAHAVGCDRSKAFKKPNGDDAPQTSADNEPPPRVEQVDEA